MSLTGIASRSRIRTPTLESLLEGHLPEGTGGAWGITSASLQSFIDGTVTPGMAGLLGVRITTAQELRDRLGREGAIGLLIGVAIQKNKDR